MSKSRKVTSSGLRSIASLEPNMSDAVVKFKVLRTKRAKIVWSKKNDRKFLITEREVADDTGKIILVLWNDDASLVRRNKSYILRGGYVRIREYTMHLQRSRTGQFIEIPDIGDVAETPDLSRPFSWRRKSPSPKRTKQGRTFDGRLFRDRSEPFRQKEF